MLYFIILYALPALIMLSLLLFYIHRNGIENKKAVTWEAGLCLVPVVNIVFCFYVFKFLYEAYRHKKYKWEDYE